MGKIKYSEQDYIKRCEELDLIYCGYDKSIPKRNYIQYKCKKHIDKGVQKADWTHFKTAVKGCPYCIGRHKTNDEIAELLKNRRITLLSQYCGSEGRILCRCDICSHEWDTIARSIISNGAGCPKCGKIKASKHEMRSVESIVEQLSDVNPYVKMIGEYKGTHYFTKFICLKCNQEFDGKLVRMLRGEAGCPYCNFSDGERKLLSFLDKNNINYKSQYIIKECKHISYLRFDAYDIDNNIAYEYNGEQHYKPTGFGGNPEKVYKDTTERDKSKIEYCERNKIPLIIIPYWEKDNMESFIMQKIQEENIDCYNFK